MGQRLSLAAGCNAMVSLWWNLRVGCKISCDTVKLIFLPARCPPFPMRCFWLEALLRAAKMNVLNDMGGVAGRDKTRHHPMAYRPDIDGLRAVAVLSVALFHAYPRSISGGFVGVDVFFVISDFLITQILLKENAATDFSLLGFYARRVRRIFPALVVMLVAVLAIGWFGMIPAQYRLTGQFTWGSALFAANLIAAGDSGYFAHAAQENPLLHLWSLGVEEQYYLFWPLMLAALFKVRKALV